MDVALPPGWPWLMGSDTMSCRLGVTMAQAAVSIQKCQTYDPELVRRALAAALKPLGEWGLM
jgi:hypothetical protein